MVIALRNIQHCWKNMLYRKIYVLYTKMQEPIYKQKLQLYTDSRKHTGVGRLPAAD